jgi:ABC-type transporter Mla subunit MlaD
MRRIAFIALLLTAVAVWVTSMAGASDSHTYRIEMYNAFGLVKGSDLRIAGVNAGSVSDLTVTPDKRALVTVETSGPLGVLGKDTRCSSEPQSLIAEYFLTCNPKGPPLPDGGTIPASHVKQTVQPDLVQDTLREPFKDRLQLLINEFGTALAGNPRDLNQAIELGAPALFQLKRALDILASENRTIRDLNANSDRIITQLANNRANVVRFIQKARDTAAISAQRRADLSTDFDRLDNFLHQLHPTLVKLGDVAQQQTPLLADLRAAAPSLNTLALRLPAFNRATENSLDSLGQAAIPGRQALKRGKDEIQTLAASGKRAFPAANALDKFLLDIDSPKRAIEIDTRAKQDTGRTGTQPGTNNTMGYTGMESLLNYVYYQTGALNQYDQFGHLLHFAIFDVGASPCGSYNASDNPSDNFPPPGNHAIGVPKAGGGTTTSISNADSCVSWLGPVQPGINQNIGQPPYDPSVCPDGSKDTSLCNPSGPAQRQSTSAGPSGQPSPSSGAPSGTGTGPLSGVAPGTAPTPQLPSPPQNPLPNNPGNAGNNLTQTLQNLLGGGGHGGGGGGGGGGGALGGLSQSGGGTGGNVGNAANDLLNLLTAP